MYEIVVESVTVGPDGRRIELEGGWELPVTPDKLCEMVRRWSASDETQEFLARAYFFRLDALNGKIAGAQTLTELNRFARYLATLQEKEVAQLRRHVASRRRLDPSECMTVEPLYLGAELREFCVEIIQDVSHSVPIYHSLALPATDMEIIDALERVRSCHGAYHIEVLYDRRGCLSTGEIEPEKIDLFELNHLARRLADLEDGEGLIFGALVKKEARPPNVARLINLAHNLENCVVVKAENLAALGRFALGNGFLPEYDVLTDEACEALDFTTLGRRFCDDQNGVLENGTFIANLASEDEMKMPYDGNPPMPDLTLDHIFDLLLGADQEDGSQVWIKLPASVAEFRKAADRCGVPNLSEHGLVQCRSIIPQLVDVLKNHENIYEISDFAEQLQRARNAGEIPKYKAILELERPTSLNEAVELASGMLRNTQQYTFLPELVCDADYGEWLLLHEYKLDRLCPAMKHFDFRAFGKERVERDGVTLTPYGMIWRNGPRQELASQDAEHTGMLLT